MASTWITRRENKNGTVSYIVGWRDHKGKTGKKTFRKKSLAKAFQADKQQKLSRREHRPVKDILFEDLAEKYRKLQESELRPKSYASYLPHINRLKTYFGSYYARDIDLEMVEGFAVELKLANNVFTYALLEKSYPDLLDNFKKKANKELLKTIKEMPEKEQDAIIRSLLGLMDNLAPATRKNCLMILSSIFIFGMEREYVDKNPVRFASRPKKPKSKKEFLTPEQMKAFLKAIDKKHRCLVLTACMTGFRLSEILGLRWCDIDFVTGEVSVRQILQEREFYDPKTDASERNTVIPDFLISVLKTHQLRQAVELEKNEHDLVFPNSVGKPMDGRNFTRRVVNPAFKVAGIKKPERPFHALRHSYVSLLAALGIDIQVIQEQVGHSSPSITWDIYRHLYPNAKKEAMEKLSKQMSELIGDLLTILQADEPSETKHKDFATIELPQA